jgi:hypothetical protein
VRIGPAILDGALPFDRALSSRKTACARVRAWLTFVYDDANAFEPYEVAIEFSRARDGPLFLSS